MKPISFVIITYNRPDDAYELLQNISGLAQAEALLSEVVVVNNASTEDYSKVATYSHPAVPLKYIDSNENLGVTRGRNYALQFAKGDIVIFLDDDSVLQNTDALVNVLSAFERPGYQERPVAIVSFKVLYYSTLQMQKNALPHKKFEDYKDKDFFYTYYFAGGAHAIKRELLVEAGNLPSEFFYGMEEYDLSYRLINNGYCITYDSSIVMLHKESPQGRKPKSDKLRMMWVNKAIVAYRYLPFIYFYSTAVMWSIEYLRKTNFHLVGWIKGWKLILGISAQQQRTPINHEAITYLKKVKARLWY